MCLLGGPEIGELVRVAVSGRFPARRTLCLPGFVQLFDQGLREVLVSLERSQGPRAWENQIHPALLCARRRC